MTERTPFTFDDAKRCQDCPLAAQPYVAGHGMTPCSVMVIGTAPSADEERTGIPFEGRTSLILRDVLAGMGLIERSYFTNVVKRRPLGKDGSNRKPTRREVYACGQHLAHEIDKLKPGIILTVGSTPLRHISGQRHELHKVHGLLLPMTRYGMRLSVLPVYDPAYIVRSGGLLTDVGQRWISDLQMIPEYLERGVG